jgi:ABC-type transport system involved in cytochrome bd biosynthesis fused ATPase/permease subunit
MQLTDRSMIHLDYCLPFPLKSIIIRVIIPTVAVVVVIRIVIIRICVWIIIVPEIIPGVIVVVIRIIIIPVSIRVRRIGSSNVSSGRTGDHKKNT